MKSNRGRKKGSFCFSMVPLSELNKVLKQDAVIIVSKKFLDNLNLKGIEKEVTTKTYNSLEEQIDFQVK
ncbi:hypothetical protein EBU71_05255 [bacterium]|nr:hypothetical protein [Candidatus Elulimicrobium humile]